MPGIDVLFVGPFDLGNNIGHPILDGVMHDELKEAIAKILQAAKDNGKSSGIYSTSGDQAREFADQGFQMVSKESRISSTDTDAGIPGLCRCRYDRSPSILDICFGQRQRLVCSFRAEHGKGCGFGGVEDDWTVRTIASFPYERALLLAVTKDVEARYLNESVNALRLRQSEPQPVLPRSGASAFGPHSQCLAWSMYGVFVEYGSRPGLWSTGM